MTLAGRPLLAAQVLPSRAWAAALLEAGDLEPRLLVMVAAVHDPACPAVARLLDAEVYVEADGAVLGPTARLLYLPELARWPAGRRLAVPGVRPADLDEADVDAARSWARARLALEAAGDEPER